ncbi:MAG TPA: uracil-DNA glycosylase [Solirubrobacteraceae bacterium]|nr:uracil-DNA glycosylase [Solirubrobacteraceae bacterium]
MKAERLQAIADDILAHLPCEFEICNEATNLVPGEGNPDADVVLIGEAPGGSEDKQGRPFVGNAGRFLDRLLGEAGLEREDVFITNVVKARPPKNRDPRVKEARHYLPWLLAQLDVIEPRVIVPLGRQALAHFAPPDVKITQAHGRVVEHEGRTIFPMFHPAAALHAARRNEDLMATVHEDARRLGETLRSL